MNQKKIIFLSPVSYFKGGAERSLFDLLSNQNIKPILLAPDIGELFDRACSLNIETSILPFGTIQNIRRPFTFAQGFKALNSLIKSAQQLKLLADTSGAQIVHSNGLKAHMINCLSYRLGGAKAILHIRDIPYTSTEKLIWRIMHVLCSSMILVSRACWYESNLPKKAVVIHNGMILSQDTNVINQQNLIRENKILKFGFIGRIHPAKGLHLLIQWLHAAQEQGFNVNLSVRGTYSSDAIGYEVEINSLIQKLNMESSIKFTGFIQDTATLYKNVDIVVVPSEVPDPLPRSVMESMAYGIPVFGYPAGGIFEMIEDGKTGFLVANSEQFLSAIRKFQKSPELLNQMIDNAKQKIHSEFTIDALHKNINRIYNHLTVN